jgi:site-specific DNA-methyltransferase (adenine-specific)
VRLIMPAHYGILSFSKGKARDLPGMIRDRGADAMADQALRSMPEFYCLRAACIKAHPISRSQADHPLGDLWHDIHRLKHNSKRVDHPCQLPPLLMRRLIGLYTNQSESVLDPFNGAGTTTLVASQMRRGAIGFELSPEYHHIAQARHADLARGVDPFAPQLSTPKAKNSRVERLPKRQYLVPKKVLQLEVREIAKQLGRLPTRDDVAKMSKHPLAYFDDYFVSWGEVCAAARNGGMSELGSVVSTSEPMLYDLSADG